jgi:hypothetical protein
VQQGKSASAATGGTRMANDDPARDGVGRGRWRMGS